MFPVGPNVRCSCETLIAAAESPDPVPVHPTPAAERAMTEARAALDTVQRRGDPIYGVTTGFGPLVEHAAHDTAHDHATGLLHHLSAGAGPAAERAIVRATILARLQALAQGHSALTPVVFDALAALLALPGVPDVPTIGSVGASGDLTPLAYIARVLLGDGTVRQPDGTVVPAREALAAAGQAPLDELSRRDALALVNGTAFMTAYAARALVRGGRLLARAEALTGWLYGLLRCRREPLNDRLHAARGHAGQAESAAAIADVARTFEPPTGDERPLQEPYAIRCAPQVLGAARDQLRYAETIITRELNGANDNPITVTEPPAVLHGGNFQGQQIAFASDALNAALTQVGLLVERQIDLLLKPQWTNDAPLLLAWTPGATSGLAGAQLTATALAAELRQHAQMNATATIPTNADNQNIVSMGTMAARAAHTQTERLAPILAVAGLALTQLTHLRRAERAPGPEAPLPDWMPAVEPIVEDRPLRATIDRIAQAWLAADDALPN